MSQTEPRTIIENHESSRAEPYKLRLAHLFDKEWDYMIVLIYVINYLNRSGLEYLEENFKINKCHSTLGWLLHFSHNDIHLIGSFSLTSFFSSSIIYCEAQVCFTDSAHSPSTLSPSDHQQLLSYSKRTAVAS